MTPENLGRHINVKYRLRLAIENLHAGHCISQHKQESLPVGWLSPYGLQTQCVVFLELNLCLDLMEFSQVEVVVRQVWIMVHLLEDHQCFIRSILVDQTAWRLWHEEGERKHHCTRNELTSQK